MATSKPLILLFKDDAHCEQVSRRFWKKVDRSGGPDACWLWTGAKKSGQDYGGFYVDGRGRAIRAHRVVWAMHNGFIPAGAVVCHKCDVQSCVNPAHLFLGTHDDNMRDMARKGRSMHGERGTGARLRESEAAEIAANDRGESLLEAAARYGVSIQTISDIRLGKKWKRALDRRKAAIAGGKEAS